MTANTAAIELEAQAASLGIHSRACREGTAERHEVYSVGCAPCEVAITAFIRWENAEPVEYDEESWSETFDSRHPGFRL
jgi:hypothetical protein